MSIKSLIGMCRIYRKSPAELMRVEDPYEAYCLNEACAYIMTELGKGKEFYRGRSFSSFSKFYESIRK